MMLLARKQNQSHVVTEDTFTQDPLNMLVVYKMTVYELSHYTLHLHIQWNLSIADTLVTAKSVLISEVSTFQG